MNHNFNKFIFKICLCISVYCLYSCNSDNALLEESLTLAGDNRHELEKVFRHFQDCPDKLYAAKYLIRNMSSHGSKECPRIDSVKSYIVHKYEMDKGSRADTISKYILSEWRRELELTSEIESDLTNISAEYLIDNIEFAVGT